MRICLSMKSTSWPLKGGCLLYKVILSHMTLKLRLLQAWQQSSEGTMAAVETTHNALLPEAVNLFGDLQLRDLQHPRPPGSLAGQAVATLQPRADSSGASCWGSSLSCKSLPSPGPTCPSTSTTPKSSATIAARPFFLAWRQSSKDTMAALETPGNVLLPGVINLFMTFQPHRPPHQSNLIRRTGQAVAAMQPWAGCSARCC